MNTRFIDILCIFIVVFHLADAQVQVKLNPLPPNLLSITDLWSLTLNNTTRTTINLILEGTLNEAGAGRIAAANSALLSLPPGKKTISYNDVTRGGKVTIKAGKWRDAFTQTGAAPNGDYTICVSVKNQAGKEIGTDCIKQHAEVNPPGLIAPADGDTLSEGETLTFTWRPSTPTLKDMKYSLKIVRVQENQTPGEAMQKNGAWYEKADIKNTAFSYPPTAKKLEKGGKYVWSVVSHSSGLALESQKYSFTLTSSYGIQVDSVNLECIPNSSSCYTCKIQIRNINAQSSSGPSNTAKTYVSSTNPASILSSGLTTSSSVNYNNIAILTGTICFSGSLPSQVSFIVKMEDALNQAFQAQLSYPVNLPNCDCCDDFIKNIDRLQITEPKPGNYLLSGLLTAGPNPICKIRAQIVNFSYVPVSIPPASNCSDCVWPSRKFGNFGQTPSLGNPVKPITTLTTIPPNNYSRELIWIGTTPSVISNTPFSVPLLIPNASPFVGCCMDTIKMCIRFSFTDTACVTCDTVISFWFTRSPLSPLHLGLNRGHNTKPSNDYGSNLLMTNPVETEKNRNSYCMFSVGILFLTDRVFRQKRRKISLKVTSVGIFLIISILLSVGLLCAQSPFCTDFNDQNYSGWLGSNAGISTSNNGSINGAIDYYLRGEDSSGGSTLYTTRSEYLGDWTPFIANGCGSLCFDIRIFNDGVASCSEYQTCATHIYTCNGGHLELPPWIKIYGSGGISAIFKTTNLLITEDGGTNPGWHHICAPINHCQGGIIPSNGMGHWEINGSVTECIKWEQILTNVIKIEFPEEFCCIPEEVVGYDNFCIRDSGVCGGACDHCCDSLATGIRSSIVHWGSTWWGWGVTANLTTSPNPITEIKSSL